MSTRPTGRELRKFAALPLCRETVHFIAFAQDQVKSHRLNGLIASDPGLALGLLRSTAWRGSDQMTVPQLARVATPELLVEIAERSLGDHPVVQRVWDHSLAVAHAARQIARTRRYLDDEFAYLAGLLHNFGLLAISTLAPDQVQIVFDRACGGEDLLAAERDVLGMTHVEVARRLGDRWSLPRWLRNVAVWHHHAGTTLPGRLIGRELIQIITAADCEVSACQFALVQTELNTPEQQNPPMIAEVTRGVTYARSQCQEQGDIGVSMPREFLANALRSARSAAVLRSQWEWKQQALHCWQQLFPNVHPAELTDIIARMFQLALEARAAACCVHGGNDTIEGTFYVDKPHPLEFGVQETSDAGSIREELLEHLKGPWSKWPHRHISLQYGGRFEGFVLVWCHETGCSYREARIREAKQLAEAWLAHANWAWETESQLEQTIHELRDQGKTIEAMVEESKLAAMAELAAGAGHEINNPLAVISGRAQLLLSEETDQRRRKALQTIADQAGRIHLMIVELMAFARPRKPDPARCPVSELVNRALLGAQRQAAERDIELRVALADDLPSVWADGEMIADAIQLVLRNALEAAGQGGHVEICAEPVPSQDRVSIRIRDTGPGIPDEIRPHIFEPFYSGRDAGRGLGMGLPKAWRIVRLHEGTIGVTSNSHGTTVRIELPAADPEMQPRRACA